jgi:serine protease Do
MIIHSRKRTAGLVLIALLAVGVAALAAGAPTTGGVQGERDCIAPPPPVFVAAPERPLPPPVMGLAAPFAADERVIVLAGRDAWLGVQVEDVTTDKLAELKLKEEYGALVVEVEENSPAAKAGLRKNDVILEYQGERVESAARLARLVRETPVGRTVRLAVSREGRTQTLSATLERREYLRGGVRVPEIRVPEINVEVFGARPRLGISADALTPQLADYFGVKQGKGVLVREVHAGTAAEKAGLKAGDVIVRVDAEEVADVGDLRRALRKKKAGEDVTLGIVRQRQETTVRLQLEESRSRARSTAARHVCRPGEWGTALRESLEEVEHELRELERELREEVGPVERELRRELLRPGERVRSRVTI